MPMIAPRDGMKQSVSKCHASAGGACTEAHWLIRPSATSMPDSHTSTPCPINLVWLYKAQTRSPSTTVYGLFGPVSVKLPPMP
eukprot:5530657-Pleurochrysis_carterae.AAC.1